jgi:hypothetical protein
MGRGHSAHTHTAQGKALEHSEELFDRADTSGDGKLQLSELRDVLRKSSEEYSHFAEHARFLDGCVAHSSMLVVYSWQRVTAGHACCRKYGGARRWNNMVGGIIKRRAQTEGPVSALREDTELDKEAFRELLTSIDRGLRALPATAQVCVRSSGALHSCDSRHCLSSPVACACRWPSSRASTWPSC